MSIGDCREIIDAGDTNREIGFGLFRARVVRACERARQSWVAVSERSVCRRWVSEWWDVLLRPWLWPQRFFRHLQGLQGKCSDLIAICVVFKELWWYVWLCARVWRKICSAFACRFIVCKGFKENAQISSPCAKFLTRSYVQGLQENVQNLALCARVLRNCGGMCGYVQRF